MINFICGNVISVKGNSVVLLCGGIGYEIFATSGTVSKIKVGEQAQIYAYLTISDNVPVMYGFSMEEERELFLNLITVGGIGAKLAVNILSSISIKELSIAIVSGNSARLAKIKGVGKKTSERIILELKEKIDAYAAESQAGESELKLAEATLTALGITRSEAVELVTRVAASGDNAEQIVLKALKETN